MIQLISCYSNSNPDFRVNLYEDSISPDGDNLGLHLVAQSLRAQRLKANIFDARRGRLSPTKTLEEMLRLEKRPQVFGISSEGGRAKSAVVELSALLKDHFPEVPIVVGGYVWLENDLMNLGKGIDVVFKGEGEDRVPAVFKYLINKQKEHLEKIAGLLIRKDNDTVIDTGTAPRITNLDRITPDYNIFFNPFIYSARNCPGQCNFCYIGKHYGGNKVISMSDHKIRQSVSKIIGKMRSKKGNVSFKDDNFLYKGGRLDLIAPLLRKTEGRVKVSFSARADSIKRNKEEIERNKDFIESVGVGTEAFCSTLLQAWNKGCTTIDNFEAVEFLSEQDIKFLPFLMLDDQYDDPRTLFQALYGVVYAPMYTTVQMAKGKSFKIPRLSIESINFSRRLPNDKESKRVSIVLEKVEEFNRSYNLLRPIHRSNLIECRDETYFEEYKRFVEEGMQLVYIGKAFYQEGFFEEGDSRREREVSNMQHNIAMLNIKIKNAIETCKVVNEHLNNIEISDILYIKLDDNERFFDRCKHQIDYLKDIYLEGDVFEYLCLE